MVYGVALTVSLTALLQGNCKPKGCRDRPRGDGDRTAWMGGLCRMHVTNLGCYTCIHVALDMPSGIPSIWGFFSSRLERFLTIFMSLCFFGRIGSEGRKELRASGNQNVAGKIHVACYVADLFSKGAAT